MLQANKASVLTGFHVGSMKVQYMEVEYLIMVLNKITSLASLLSGFAASAFLQSTGLQHEGSWLKVVYVLCTSSALGFMLLVLLICTLCTMWGPGLALRGPEDSSLTKAVDIMNSSVRSTFRIFSVGLASYLFSSILSMSLLQPTLSCFVSITIISIGGLLICRAGWQVVDNLSPKYVTSAAIQGDPFSFASRLPGDKEESHRAADASFGPPPSASPYIHLCDVETGVAYYPPQTVLLSVDREQRYDWEAEATEGLHWSSLASPFQGAPPRHPASVGGRGMGAPERGTAGPFGVGFFAGSGANRPGRDQAAGERPPPATGESRGRWPSPRPPHCGSGAAQAGAGRAETGRASAGGNTPTPVPPVETESPRQPSSIFLNESLMLHRAASALLSLFSPSSDDAAETPAAANQSAFPASASFSPSSSPSCPSSVPLRQGAHARHGQVKDGAECGVLCRPACSENDDKRSVYMQREVLEAEREGEGDVRERQRSQEETSHNPAADLRVARLLSPCSVPKKTCEILVSEARGDHRGDHGRDEVKRQLTNKKSECGNYPTRGQPFDSLACGRRSNRDDSDELAISVHHPAQDASGGDHPATE
ncbi:hypothetical protein BESB_045780 [Besnoitia besnoiti]|uniref:Transmembrane protein n=1 Tax=Besnoitia besnoiti TaxID=94643 RepID=A0A2A9MK86_BESBE|nr:hypothetical protein BESB_045780 [Besnoitia besnoiti]PFH36386.1 hypothetical protein BESB_045780 [Besnoitia besnoiti]